MDDTKRIFQKIISGQSAMKSELIVEIRKVDKKVDKVREDLVSLEKRLTARIDKIGKQTAYLEDDTPTIEEFNRLEKRVTKLEQKSVAV